MAEATCATCGHPRTMGRCWRLTCPTNGARESFLVVDRHDIEAKSAAEACKVMFGHPATWPAPPDQGMML